MRGSSAIAHARPCLCLASLAALVLTSTSARAQPEDEAGRVVLGIKLSAGGRYDTVRLCVATGQDVPGGPAADVSFFTEVSLGGRARLTFDLPVMRPILFATAFDMLQFEPEITLAFRVRQGDDLDLWLGSGLGLSLHHGPDWHSPIEPAERRPAFFAIGPRASLYLGLGFPRPGEIFDFQLGLRPYVIALMGVDDPEDHRGPVLGGQLEGQLRFDPSP